MGRVSLTRPFVLLALAALLAPRIEASRTSVWESNPPASLTTTRADAASARVSLAPAAAADIEAEEPPLFNLGDVVIVEREIEHEERFNLGSLTLVDLNLLRGPPPSYPENRVRGFELLAPFRVGASLTLSLWSRRACGSLSCGLASDSRYDPWGLLELPEGPLMSSYTKPSTVPCGCRQSSSCGNSKDCRCSGLRSDSGLCG